MQVWTKRCQCVQSARTREGFCENCKNTVKPTAAKHTARLRGEQNAHNLVVLMSNEKSTQPASGQATRDQILRALSRKPPESNKSVTKANPKTVKPGPDPGALHSGPISRNIIRSLLCRFVHMCSLVLCEDCTELY